ncbi:MAG: transcriptional regulator [Marmoricola sp.]
MSQIRTVYSLRISCDRSYPAIIADIRACMLEVHPERRTYLVPAPGMVDVQSYWRHWPCLFPQHGPGRKHERVLGMAGWQWAIVEEHPAAFLRGLFHSDGCRVDNWATRMVAGEKKRYAYPRWQFSNRSEEILGWCGDALDLVGIPWRRSHRWVISVSRRGAVETLDRLIGPKR